MKWHNQNVKLQFVRLIFDGLPLQNVNVQVDQPKGHRNRIMERFQMYFCILISILKHIGVHQHALLHFDRYMSLWWLNKSLYLHYRLPRNCRQLSLPFSVVPVIEQKETLRLEKRRVSTILKPL
ncbi:hypothetical protein [Paenibacillus radicis (ex Gao et al. 2016)]|uniref:hypothetical protein n=1 Tax=Paenibacillus radicis (ex Gao et al. 2016) TaxID=1737354 RepID=UPI001663AA5B|nr:hypothetical protein [Paenibacillus radicis (ex Gao et al. 2016)]